MALAGHKMASSAYGPWRRIRALDDLRRGRMFVGEPVRRIRSATDLRRIVFLAAARHVNRSRQLWQGRLILIGNVVGPGGQSVGNGRRVRGLRRRPQSDQQYE